MSWQKILTQGFSSAASLLNFLELPPNDAKDAEAQFSTRVPLSFAQRMRKKDPQDPLLLQVLAAAEEMIPVEGYELDPLAESTSNHLKGLIHKYHGRVLLTVTGVCAVNCRYCFRRHFPYQQNNPGRTGWDEVISYIQKDDTLTEVILSGGDPLMASNTVLKELISKLEQIPHLHTLRIHTRIPIVFPERMDQELLSILAGTRLNKVVVLHCNHAQELDEQVYKVCTQLRALGCQLFNQSVLLSGINNTVERLAALSHALFKSGIIPYYLHVLDKVKGAAHFDLSLAEAKSLHSQLQTILPGYLVPRLACEEPGQLSKTLIF